MYEHLAAFSGGLPNRHHLSLYSQWAKHDWGMIITGNVQVSKSHLTLGRDNVIPSVITEEGLQAYRNLATAISNDARSPDKLQQGTSETLVVMQLSHAGRQSPNFLGGRWPFVAPLAPSAVPFGTNRNRAENVATRVLNRVLFQTPRAMSVSDIDQVVDAFVRGARMAAATGFHGVQLHAAHGCEFYLSVFSI
jgi:2,4-dienoyl-CoA reductase-like NADH-dependent reductase (Old Yellow Enzyme family)